MNNAHSHKRYPGVKPFSTAERDLFFGRDRDIDDLLDLLWLEKLVVLFGKSGYGKSSLINAGLLPELAKDAVPIVVRLGACVPGQSPTPIENVRAKLEEVLSDNPTAQFIQKLPVAPTLWQLVKSKQSEKNWRYVLIFDQFEEFFTYPVADQQVFKEQLADLLYTEVPQAVRNLTETMDSAQQTFVATPFVVKVLLSIRSDRMSLLDSMKDKLSAILQKRYELKGLTEAQAREAIERPARREGNFDSPAFTYSPEALQAMTQKLAETRGTQRSAGIEAFQLQILCEYLEDKIIAGEIPQNRVLPEHFANKISEVFEGYYQRLLNKLAPEVQLSAQLLIEEKLIFEDKKTREARRLSIDSGVLLSEPGITQELLNQLESTFLLRRESTAAGGFNYEVTHDTMIAPVLASKSARRVREAAAANQREARRKQQRLVATLMATLLVLVLVIGLVVYVLDLRNKALDALVVARQEKSKAEDALKEVLATQRAKEIIEIKIQLHNVKSILKADNCPPEATIRHLRDMQAKYSTDTQLQGQIKEVLGRLGGCE